jgi:hypothetical protein
VRLPVVQFVDNARALINGENVSSLQHFVNIQNRHVCDNINSVQCIEGALLKTVLPICIY